MRLLPALNLFADHGYEERDEGGGERDAGQSPCPARPEAGPSRTLLSGRSTEPPGQGDDKTVHA